MELIRDPAQLAAFAGAAFVPTMGALHQCHLALMQRAIQLADCLIISIFVNPTQFEPDEDYGRYPRTLDADLRAAGDLGVDVAFVPDVRTMYPAEQEIPVPPLPDVATEPRLEDVHRPRHFAGVCQVMARLLDLVKPSVMLAADGFELSAALAESINRFVQDRGLPHEATVAALSKGGTPYASGETWKQPDLSSTLERVMRDRRDGFYKGPVAKLLAEEMKRHGGLIALEDLRGYTPEKRTPFTFKDGARRLVCMPPPSSGGVAVVEILNILEGYDLAGMGHNSARYLHVLTEAMRRAFADRAEDIYRLWLPSDGLADAVLPALLQQVQRPR